MEPEIEMAFFMLFIVFLGGFAWIVANNSHWLPKFVNLFRYKSEDEIEGKKDSPGTAPVDKSETETKGE